MITLRATYYTSGHNVVAATIEHENGVSHCLETDVAMVETEEEFMTFCHTLERYSINCEIVRS